MMLDPLSASGRSVVSRAHEAPVSRLRLGLSWLITMRWGACVGQLVAVALAQWCCDIALPLGVCLTLIGLAAAANFGLLRWAKRGGPVPELAVSVAVAGDIVLLTLLLAATGGPTNPFFFFYLIHLALAATLLPAKNLMALQALMLTCAGMLFFWHYPLPQDIAVMPTRMMCRAMWGALALAGMFVCTFVQRLCSALEEAHAQLSDAKQRAARDEQLSSLATLAAGAAHELSTPLSTISISTREMERRLERQGGDKVLEEDIGLVRREVERARGILTQLVDDAGASIAEPAHPIAAVDLVAAALAGLAAWNRVRVVVAPGAEDAFVRVPRRSLARSLRALVNNAIEASRQRSAAISDLPPLSASSPVEVYVERSGPECRLVVRDQGSGMSQGVLERATEPFFSTKGPGRGMGLGLFLARSVLERLGGGLMVQSRPNVGTTVTLMMPVIELTVVPRRGAHDIAPYGREDGYPYGPETGTPAHASFG